MAAAWRRRTGRCARGCRSGWPAVPGSPRSPALFVWFSHPLNAASDDVYARVLQAPPPACRRSPGPPPVQPPVQPPAAPGARDRLRTFLRPEIEAGLVEVLGSRGHAGRAQVRGKRGLFALRQRHRAARLPCRCWSASAAALKAETGSGAGDRLHRQPADPHRAFPSNFQLSAARAEAARAILAARHRRPRAADAPRAGPMPTRSPPTPPRRAAKQNRRIEIVLRRPGLTWSADDDHAASLLSRWVLSLASARPCWPGWSGCSGRCWPCAAKRGRPRAAHRRRACCWPGPAVNLLLDRRRRRRERALARASTGRPEPRRRSAEEAAALRDEAGDRAGGC